MFCHDFSGNLAYIVHDSYEYAARLFGLTEAEHRKTQTIFSYNIFLQEFPDKSHWDVTQAAVLLSPNAA